MGIYNSRRIEDIPLKSAEDLLNLKLIWDQSLNHKVWRLSKTTHLSEVVAFIKNNYLKRFETNIAHIEMFILFALDIVNAKWDYTEYMQLVPSSLIFIEITKLRLFKNLSV